MNKRNAGVVTTLQFANGRPRYAGTIASSGTGVSNSTTATPFTLDAGEWLTVQPDSAVYIGFGGDSATAITASSSTNGLKLQADEKFSVLTHTNESFLAITPVSGSANLKVWTQS